MFQSNEHHHNHSESNILTTQQVSRLTPLTEFCPAFSGLLPMTGFHQRTSSSAHTVLVNAGLWLCLTPFPYSAQAPGKTAFTVLEPLFVFLFL